MSAPVDSPYTMKDQDKDAKALKPTTKSYMNKHFLKSHDARIIRILCEFQEPAQRLNKHQVKGTILFFGSARAMRKEDFVKTYADIERQHAASFDEATKATLSEKLAGFKRVEWMCEWVDKSEELARILTHWALTSETLRNQMSRIPDYLDVCEADALENGQPLVVTTGGGPGIMEAANKGAASVPGAKTMGMGISLPFENGLNPYVSDGLEFEFHYFFTRKFWMMYSARALIIAPGGFGTMDELFELMTLKQTKKIPDLPIVLLCSTFWKTVVNWQALADFGTVSQKEVDSLIFADTPEEALTHIKAFFEKNADGAKYTLPSPQSKPVNHGDAPSPLKV
ncbi:Hypothetical protein, putative [Bodo saltans]|uniref:Lysine decarboxylase-like protein n=1 Tax=Bodo saltans TaxID=75058 RepID=A0A0S4KLV2_BODSA|nr:Hypothetical protein, putative [Bodo saltans]|eukprot:CUI14577.1 Hypothetical protein, putative [Bodo saltans]